MKFDDLKFESHPTLKMEDAIQALHFFDNGYGISVVRFPGSYGFIEDLYEVAVLRRSGENDFVICYDTPITDGIIGHCDETEIENLMEDISKL